jgi:DNA-directed RNA polymerase subunit M/transcription elongation factor TFIIS
MDDNIIDINLHTVPKSIHDIDKILKEHNINDNNEIDSDDENHLSSNSEIDNTDSNASDISDVSDISDISNISDISDISDDNGHINDNNTEEVHDNEVDYEDLDDFADFDDLEYLKGTVVNGNNNDNGKHNNINKKQHVVHTKAKRYKKLPQPPFNLDEFERNLKSLLLETTKLKPNLVNDYIKLIRNIFNQQCDELYITSSANKTHIYTNICIRYNAHLNNGYLCEKLNDGIINLGDVQGLKLREINPDKWKSIEEIQKANLILAQRTPEATTDIYKCPKCHKNRCTHYERQDRSSDEGMTTHITCINCGFKWKNN